MAPPRTIVYVDGFNLYFGAVKSTPYKWLNIAEMCRLLLPKFDIRGIKYFTARVVARPGDPDQPVRQEVFLRALRTLPNFSIIFGHFLSHVVSMPLAAPTIGGPKFARVIKTEEKGSDVNLATHLLNDAFKDSYDVAVIVSNDSDLLEPIRIVRNEIGKIVGILNPHPRPSQALLTQASFIKQIRKGVLAASQFPPAMQGANGAFHKPVTW